MTEPVLLLRDGAVAHLRFNRPESLNAVDVATAQAFARHVDTIAGDPSVRAVVLSGEGRAFGAGGDLSALEGDPVTGAPKLLDPVHAALARIGEMPVPFVASLHGVVAGGSLSVAMACDLAIATSATKFNLSYVRVGACCDGGATWTLPRLVGMRNALAIALLGDTFDAAEALRLGLVHRVVDAERADEEALALAQRLAQGPTAAIGRMKQLMRTGLEHGFAEQLNREREVFFANAASADFAEGIAAFRAKRRPVFQGR